MNVAGQSLSHHCQIKVESFEKNSSKIVILDVRVCTEEEKEEGIVFNAFSVIYYYSM